jgi:two-component sensor histidine kinase
MLLAELNHRVKNMLAVVTGIASQTARSSRSISAFNANFMARLSSLSLAHSLLTAGNWEAMSLHRLVEELLGPYANPNDGQLSISGPEMAMRPKGALAMSMILHELVTNATKYGALSRPEGRISVEWSVTPGPAGRVSFNWRESGVAGLTRPRRTGFGSRMIEASVRHELGGEVELIYGPDGIAYRFAFPSNQ